jgi:SM-20-related protein
LFFGDRQLGNGVVSADLQPNSKSVVLAHGLMPPYLVLRDFFDEETVTGLLDYAVTHQSDFTPAQVGTVGRVNPSFRISASLGNLGEFRQILEAKILGLLPALVAQLRVSRVEEPKLVTELVAHSDGAFYKRHIDTAHDHDTKRIRILSCVYYFNVEPKAFTGGALRLHAIGGKESEDFVDIEPVRNSLAVFLAWAPHEVLPVSCPSKRFIDSRFAINCWILGNRKSVGSLESRA